MPELDSALGLTRDLEEAATLDALVDLRSSNAPLFGAVTTQWFGRSLGAAEVDAQTSAMLLRSVELRMSVVLAAERLMSEGAEGAAVASVLTQRWKLANLHRALVAEA